MMSTDQVAAAKDTIQIFFKRKCLVEGNEKEEVNPNVREVGTEQNADDPILSSTAYNKGETLCSTNDNFAASAT